MDSDRVLSKQLIAITLSCETIKHVVASHWLTTVNATVHVTVTVTAMVAHVSAFVSR